MSWKLERAYSGQRLREEDQSKTVLSHDLSLGANGPKQGRWGHSVDSSKINTII